MSGRKIILTSLFCVAFVVLAQSWNGMLYRQQVPLKAVHSEEDAEIVRFRLPSNGRSCARAWQSGTELRGPYRNIKEAQAAGPGSFSIRRNFLYAVLLPPPLGSDLVVEISPPLPLYLTLGAAVVCLGLMMVSLCRQKAGNQFQGAPGKLDYLESLRGLACIIVCNAHLFQLYLGSDNETHRGFARWMLTSLMNSPFNLAFAGQFAVCIFFILSGFVLALPFTGALSRQADDFKRAMIRRPLRLAGIMLAAMFVSYALWGSRWYSRSPSLATVDEKPSLAQLLLHLLFEPFNASQIYCRPFWTIQIELYGSLVEYMILWLSQGRPWRWALYLLAGLLMHSTYYVGFVAGMAMADAIRSGYLPIKRAEPWLSSGCIIAGLWLAAYRKEPNSDSFFDSVYRWLPAFDQNILAGGYDMIAAALIMYGVITNGRVHRALRRPLLVEAGRLSYALYGFHVIILCSVVDMVFLWLYPNLVPSYWLSVGCAALVFVPMCWLVSWLATTYIDVPSTRLSKAVSFRLFPQ